MLKIENRKIKLDYSYCLLIPMFQHALEDRRATGSYLWRIRQPGSKGVPSYLFATLEGPGPWKQKTDIISLVPENVMEAFEVPLIKHINRTKLFVHIM